MWKQSAKTDLTQALAYPGLHPRRTQSEALPLWMKFERLKALRQGKIRTQDDSNMLHPGSTEHDEIRASQKHQVSAGEAAH